MKSAEEATGISLVKVKEPKADVYTDARLDNIEENIAVLHDALRGFMEWSRFPVHEKLAEAYIKPSANKPHICIRNG